ERFNTIINPSTGGPSTFGGIVITFGPSVDVRKTDIISVAKGTLRGLRADINATLPSVSDKMTRYHLQDVVERITRILEPK
ncbi:MAG: hypothetical protein H7Y27_00840, partial [Gemmatimonadaceae bacterium]|nr:hypothetical protein [Chitinophagaceae bacterium]